MNNQQSSVPWDAGCAWYLVRHGETDWNRAGRIQGHSDTPLNRRGETQASLLGQRLRDTEFSAVYASDLTRTMTTARLVAGERGPKIAPIPELREFAYGEWEGLTFAEIEARDPEGFAKRMLRRNARYAPPGGESVEQVVERVRRFHEQVRARHVAGEQVLVVGHGGSLLAFLICLLGLPSEFLMRFRLSTTGLSIVRTFDDAAVLELWNDTSHLASIGALEDEE